MLAIFTFTKAINGIGLIGATCTRTFAKSPYRCFHAKINPAIEHAHGHAESPAHDHVDYRPSHQTDFRSSHLKRNWIAWQRTPRNRLRISCVNEQ